MPTRKLDALLNAFTDVERILILTHNDPDPDAIGGAVALRHLLTSRLNVNVKIAYRGLIGRAENRALVKYLDQPLQQFSKLDLAPPVAVALVDTQPGVGNSPLRQPADVALVIDHHPWHPGTATARFADVQTDVGATSTILTGYLRAADLDFPVPIATALFYSIKTDTLGLGRSNSAADRIDKDEAVIIYPYRFRQLYQGLKSNG